MLKYNEIKIIVNNNNFNILEEMICLIDNILGINIINFDEFKNYMDNAPSWEYFDDDFLENIKDNSIISIYIQEDNLESILNSLNELLKENDIKPIRLEILKIDDIDWNKKWKESYKPIDLGNFIICPSWLYNEHDYNFYNTIIIDPGMAFGTGTHETTASCIKLIDTIDLDKKEVIDIGCGSGILSIQCDKKGAVVVATDIDKRATEVAIQNISLNKANNIKVNHVEESDKLEGSYYLVIANILHSAILSLLPQIESITKKDGYFIASGILEKYENTMDDAFKNCFETKKKIIDNQWITYLLKRK